MKTKNLTDRRPPQVEHEHSEEQRRASPEGLERSVKNYGQKRLVGVTKDKQILQQPGLHPCVTAHSVNFHGDKRSREMHESKTCKDAYLFKKSKGVAAKLSYMGIS